MSKTPNTQFPDHFKAFVDSLNTHEVEYLLIGGYAMGAYGHHRGTGDLDIFVHATEENAEKLMKASIDYGIPSESLKKEMFLVAKMIGIGEPPLRIELLKKLDVVDFNYAYDRHIKKNIDGIDIKVVSLEDLVLLKKAAVNGRDQSRDREDLSFLQKLVQKLTKKDRDQ